MVISAAAIQERRTAFTALPGINTEVAQDMALEKTISVDPHSRPRFARGTFNFARPYHWLPVPMRFSLARSGAIQTVGLVSELQFQGEIPETSSWKPGPLSALQDGIRAAP